MFDEWMMTSWSAVGLVLLSGLITYSAIILYTRIVGLRSLSKMSAADFVMTVAVGSVMAGTISAPDPPVAIGLAALAMLYAGQWVIAFMRQKFNWFSKLVDNEPLLLMAGRTMLDDNLRQANVTRADVYGKLREANALNYDEVLAVVFETTGDISVLHSADADATLEADFLQNVIGADRLFGDG